MIQDASPAWLSTFPFCWSPIQQIFGYFDFWATKNSWESLLLSPVAWAIMSVLPSLFSPLVGVSQMPSNDFKHPPLSHCPSLSSSSTLSIDKLISATIPLTICLILNKLSLICHLILSLSVKQKGKGGGVFFKLVTSPSWCFISSLLPLSVKQKLYLWLPSVIFFYSDNLLWPHNLDTVI